MRFFVLTIAIIQSLVIRGQQKEGLLRYVNPLTGTANSTTQTALKHGGGTELLANTIPAVTLPFAMTQWTPQTRTTEQKCLAPYYYKDTLLSGFRGTHWLSGSCTQDYGSVTIMPLTGKLQTAVSRYATPFSHNNEKATPAYYKTALPQYEVTAEITATKRCSFLQFTLEKEDIFYLLVSPNSDKGKGFVKVDKQRNEIVGYNPAYRIYQGAGQPAGFSGYFVVQVQAAFTESGTYRGDTVFKADSIRDEKNIGAYIGINTKKGGIIRVKVGTSFTSVEAARRNLQQEISGWDFTLVKTAAEAAWETTLAKVQVRTASEKDKRIFYTAVYHSLQHPRLFNDADGSYPKFSGDYETLKLPEGNYYDDFSMWDIYRAQMPLLSILEPGLVKDCVRSMILKGQQGGWLPIFPCWNSYTAAMIGDHVTAFFASAYVRGIGDYDAEEAYRLMRQNAFTSPKTFAEYKEGKGRRALQSYLQYGYIPLEDSVKEAFHKMEQVSRTLEYAFDDYALAIMAKAWNKKEDYEVLMNRAKNYQRVYDSKVGLMNGRYKNGSFYKDFKPDKKLSFITEGTSRQYTFYVPHDVKGLAALMGGEKNFEKALDSLFVKGEYWHGNEPGHQIPFLYNYTSAPWKTQKEVRRIVREEYDDGPGGLSGNDDAGQVSAWYVFAAIGLYPVNPASDEYVITSPLFDAVVIALANGSRFTINTIRKSKSSIYIQSTRLNGKAYTKNYVKHADIVKGGTMEIFLDDKPSVSWGIKESNRPSSISKSPM